MFNQLTNLTIRITNLFAPKRTRKTFAIALVQGGGGIKRAAFNQDTGTLRLWFRNGSCSDFHGADWEQFRWLIDPVCDAEEAFREIRTRLSFFTQVANPADANYVEYFGH